MSRNPLKRIITLTAKNNSSTTWYVNNVEYKQMLTNTIQIQNVFFNKPKLCRMDEQLFSIKILIRISSKS